MKKSIVWLMIGVAVVLTSAAATAAETKTRSPIRFKIPPGWMLITAQEFEQARAQATSALQELRKTGALQGASVEDAAARALKAAAQPRAGHEALGGAAKQPLGTAGNVVILVEQIYLPPQALEEIGEDPSATQILDRDIQSRVSAVQRSGLQRPRGEPERLIIRHREWRRVRLETAVSNVDGHTWRRWSEEYHTVDGDRLIIVTITAPAESLEVERQALNTFLESVEIY